MSAQEFGLWLQYRPHRPAWLLELWAELMAALHNGPMKKGRGKRSQKWVAGDFYTAPEWKFAPPPAALPAPPTLDQIKAAFERMARG
jgi:hypothetical protein